MTYSWIINNAIAYMDTQYFGLIDVLDILALDSSEDEALQLMRESDVYSFLLLPKPEFKVVEAKTLPNGHSHEAGVDVADVSSEPDSIRLAFRHIGIMNAIYDSLSFEERIGMNAFVARVLEGLLREDNQDTLLPSIEFHYSRTGEVLKIIQYREKMGSLCLLRLAYYAQYFGPKLQPAIFRAATRYGDTEPAHGYSLAFNTYMSGDLDYVERFPNAKFAQNPTLKENKLLAYYAAHSSLRMALCRGRDQAEINRLWGIFEPHGRFADAIKFGMGNTELYKMWYLAYQGEGDYKASLGVLEAHEEQVDINGVGAMNADTLSAGCLCAVLFFDGARSDVPVPQAHSMRPKSGSWGTDELARMIRVLSNLVIKTDKIKIQVVAYWALQGFEAMVLILRGRAKAAVRLLKTRLRSRKGRADLEYLQFFLGVFSGLIGKYSNHDAPLPNQALLDKAGVFSVADCQNACVGLGYSAVQVSTNGEKCCWCGNALPTAFAADCTKETSSPHNVLGGPDSFGVYQVLASSNTVAHFKGYTPYASVKGAGTSTCYGTGVANTFVSASAPFWAARSSESAMTIGICTGACSLAGYKYAALGKGQLCFCGNTDPANTASNVADASSCATPCTGDINEVCGGSGYYTIYQGVTAGVPVPSVSFPKFASCFAGAIDGNTEILPANQPLPNQVLLKTTVTVAACQSACLDSNFAFSAVQTSTNGDK
ncbi:hypothetical protein HK101_010320, partial [Irineochytrium annulatum]